MVSAENLAREEELYWLALHLAPGLGSRRTIALLEHFVTPQAIFRAPVHDLEALGCGAAAARSLASAHLFEEAASQQELMMKCGARLIVWASAAYPERLRSIYDPPAALYVRGRTELLNTVNIGMVGTRRPSPYGMAAAERIAGELSGAGICVVSGMARGIDTKSHQAALAAGGDTVAVFGCGVDVIYPTENRHLAEQISERGLLVSEYAMGSPGYPQNFPVRNRIISGMSAGVLVVEGAQYSGSAITAKLAAEQGREVFAIPGNITSKMSWAPNLLIKQGAKLVQEWNDVVAELPEADRLRLAARHRQQLLALEENLPSPDGSDQVDQNVGVSGHADPAAGTKRGILKTLAFDKASQLDQVIECLQGHSASEVIAALFEMELNGTVRQLPGKHYIKVWVD